MLLVGLLIVGVMALAFVVAEVKKRHIDIWLLSYLRGRWHGRPAAKGPTHIMFAFCDHYEPGWGRPPIEKERERVDRWVTEYPKMARRHKDAAGNHPKHTFFYPEEEYRREHLDKLTELCRQGFGEIEVHLHHDDDTAEGLVEKLTGFMATLRQQHGAIPDHPVREGYGFAFIHGNWALDNSRPDGRWCGVNNELKVLRESGCYADFTLPSAPSDTQTSKINSIYYATGKDRCSKSHDTGVDVEVGVRGDGDLMIIQGPLLLNWKSRKFGFFPKIENGDIRTSYPPTPDRVDLWVDAGIHVKGRPEWIFIKVHTHGTQDEDMATLLGEGVDNMHRYLSSKYNDSVNYCLHYVSAREMYNIVKAAEAGLAGDPEQYRNYAVQRPPMFNQTH